MMKNENAEKIRIDKWLWAVRLFKTRTLAADACHAGKVKIDGESAKASRHLKLGDTITLTKGQERKIIKVLTLIENRVGAPVALTCYEDLSPPPTTAEQAMSSVFYLPNITRDRGTGRPTKKERRSLDKFIGDEDEEDMSENQGPIEGLFEN